MLKNLFNLLFAIWADQRGDAVVSGGQTVYENEETVGEEENKKESDADNKRPPEGDKGPENGDDDKAKGDKVESPEGDQEESEEGQGKYGEYGDDADAVWAAHNALKGKTTATESNLAALRSALDESGVVINKDESGKITFTQKPKDDAPAPEVESKFTKEHREKLAGFFETQDDGESFVDLITLLAEDLHARKSQEQQQMTAKQKAELTKFQSEQATANQILDDMFPELDPGDRAAFSKGGKPTNPNFNQVFYDRATEIWKDKYTKDPYGELKASREAATELQIHLKRSGEAEKKGFEKGKASKKVVGPVGSSSSKSGDGKLTKQEYLNLSEEDRAKYDMKRL